MLENFFQLSPIPTDQMVGSYDARLVVLSYLVATFASYIALDITGRLRDISNTQLSTTLWLCGGALAMGAGIWSMHFIGMLAFSMDMPMMYDIYWTALSMLVAIFASAFALFLLKAKVIHLTQTIIGGVILGFAIAAMHYTGMTAMTNMNIHYLPSLFFLSILIAIIASEVAIYLALKSTQVIASMRFRLKFVSAFIMGAAICGMHYTGMAAAVFTAKSTHSAINTLNPELMAISIAAVTTILLSIAFIASTYKESLNQQMLITARQAGMAEVAASVLHNIGNVLNSINVSSLLLSERISQSKLSTLNDLKQLLEKYDNDINKLITENEHGKHLPEFLNNLTDYWKNEKLFLINEIQTLVKNIDHVKNIIATQQDLSRVVEFKQILSIKNLLEEAILISGIENNRNTTIHIEKNYSSIKPVMVDKVKLLQILVNLIQNAKDSVLQSEVAHKRITLQISAHGNILKIEIKDNGLGILKENLTRIFAYGFTTKPNGHGFGLHMSAVSTKEMGGNLKVLSDGLGKGATFIIELPYVTR